MSINTLYFNTVTLGARRPSQREPEAVRGFSPHPPPLKVCSQQPTPELPTRLIPWPSHSFSTTILPGEAVPCYTGPQCQQPPEQEPKWKPGKNVRRAPLVQLSTWPTGCHPQAPCCMLYCAPLHPAPRGLCRTCCWTRWKAAGGGGVGKG